MGNFKENPKIVKVIASDKNWIEGDAIQQLENTANLAGMKMAVGLPDLHPGKGNPIGAAFITENKIYPQLVGNDIGCGMGLWQTSLKSRKLKLDKSVEKLDIESSENIDKSNFIKKYGLKNDEFISSLGTIGGGNHFAELQSVLSVEDKELFDKYNLDKDRLYLLVHSGSRGLGETILREHTDKHQHNGLDINSDDFEDYISKHNYAVKWAEANREIIAHNFIGCLKGSVNKVLDVNHNTVLPYEIGGETYYLHRKGATPSTEGIVMIPGSRGSVSYLVLPVGDKIRSAFSLAHGAGRKWKRKDAKGKLANYKTSDFLHTELNSRVICNDKELIYEEAPQAYKNIDIVVDDLVKEGLVKIIAILKPVITYKTRRVK